MKQIIFIILLSDVLLFNNIYSQENDDRKWSHRGLQESNKKSIKMISSVTCVISGLTGTLIRTSNCNSNPDFSGSPAGILALRNSCSGDTGAVYAGSSNKTNYLYIKKNHQINCV